MSSLLIKNMVCDRCISTVRKRLQEMGCQVETVRLGEAEIRGELSEAKLSAIGQKLQDDGFELIIEEEAALAESIKTQLIAYIQLLEEKEAPPKLSDYLSDQMHRNYSSLSSHFSNYEDITVEQYVIHLKIERVKELLSYGEMTLSEIAYKLNYSSVAYLSNQFKKVVGMSVTDYKKAKDSFRKSLDSITD